MKALPDDWWDPKRERTAFPRRSRAPTCASPAGRWRSSPTTSAGCLPTDVRPITAKLLESAGLRIDDINETTRSAIVDTLTEGTQRGYSIQQLVHGVPDEASVGSMS
jgi:hypothetical protein